MVISVVPDTNVIIKGMLGYKSVHRKILNLSLAKRVVMYGSQETYAEFCNKIRIPRLQRYWNTKLFSPDNLILDYRTLVEMIEPINGMSLSVKIRDPKDEIFLKVAKTNGAKIVITEDKDLLSVKQYEDIYCITAEQFFSSFTKAATDA